MSNCKIYGIYDEAMGLVAIQKEDNDAIAIRNFSDGVNDERSPLHKHPEAYKLYKICTVDTMTGKMLEADCTMLVKADECLLEKK